MNNRMIADIVAESGTKLPLAANTPLSLDDSQSVWLVESGAVDIFVVERKNGVEQAALALLTRVKAGCFVFGVAPQSGDTTLSLLAKGLPGTVLSKLSVKELAALEPAELANLVDAWIMDLSAALSRDIACPPLPDVLAEVEQTQFEKGRTISARRGVVWANVPDSTEIAGHYLGLVEVAAEELDDVTATDVVPLTSESWLELTSMHQLSGVLASASLAGQGRLLPALTRFHELVISTERINRMLKILDQANLERASSAARRVDEEHARRQLFEVPGAQEQRGIGDEDSALAMALQVIGQREGIEFKWPRGTDGQDTSPKLGDILDVSSVRGRKVRVESMDRWWFGDSGAMLAFRADDDSPVVLLPSRLLGRYRLFDPVTGRSVRVTSELAESIKDEAWLFYRSLEPASTRIIDLLALFGRGVGATAVARFAVAGLVSGLIMLLSALVFGFVVDQAIPTAEMGLVYSATVGLAGFAGIWALVYILQGMALMRFEGYVASRLEAAIWDRLLRLPLEILDQYTAGDRAMRGMAFHRLRNTIQGVVANNVLSIIFLLPALIAIFFVDVVLGGITAVFGLLVYILQGMALMRFEGYVASRLEAAIWDRLLRLPLEILDQYTAGDRAMRGMAFHRLRNTIQGVVANNVLSIIFLLPALIAIFFVDVVLGGITAVFGLLFLIVTVILGLKQVSPYERMIRASNRLTGVLFQFINGISKLRIDGAEGSAYAEWARHYGEQQHAKMELGTWDAYLRAFGTALPLFAAAVLFAAATLRGLETFSAGDFLLVYVAFLLFVFGVVRLGASFGAVAAVAPELSQIEPFLAEAPEASRGQESVEYLGGDLFFDHVSFRYDAEGPMILDGVSIRARRGEFIAIAGESGAGKSTLFRLALGLNEPNTGTVYYDERDLRQLNVKQVRQNIGVVPQKGGLIPQDIWDNIASDREDVDAEAVWQAARTAQVDAEIEKMPMQMLTCVGDSQSVMSGGEIQRITIARALARDPRILLLDEATNFLDNEIQSKVMSQMAQLPMTRVVIAHRLSTLLHADRIYMMQSGKVVEQGTYQELIAADGAFRDLVRRQET